MFALIAVGVTLESCVHEPLVPKTPITEVPAPPAAENCDPNVIDFENEIAPLLRSNCAKAGCHDATTAKEGIRLDNYKNIMASDVVKAFDARDSELFEKITEDDREDAMPPPGNQLLSLDQIDLIKTWINQGAQNVTCSTANCDVNEVSYAAMIRPLLDNKCVGCHSGTAAGAGLDFTTHSGIQAVALNGRLWGAINHADGFSPMPKGGKLSQCEINKIEVWINQGAPNT